MFDAVRTRTQGSDERSGERRSDRRGRNIVKASVGLAAGVRSRVSAGGRARGLRRPPSLHRRIIAYGARGRRWCWFPDWRAALSCWGRWPACWPATSRSSATSSAAKTTASPCGAGSSWSDLVDDLAEFLDWFGLERPAVMGVSFGGVLALELAARQPHRLESLIVQGVGARFEKGLLQQVAGMVLSRYPLPSDNPFVNQFFNLLFGSRQKPGPLFQFVTRQCWQTDQGVMAHRFQSGRVVRHGRPPGPDRGADPHPGWRPRPARFAAKPGRAVGAASAGRAWWPCRAAATSPSPRRRSAWRKR